MKVIFLNDIDGVLTSIASIADYRKKFPNIEIMRSNPHKMHVKWLNKIIEATDAKIIVSSSWRYSFSSIAMWRFLAFCGFTGEVIDNIQDTPIYCRVSGSYSNYNRGTAIQNYLESFKYAIDNQNYLESFKYNIDKFIILANNDDMGELMDHLIQTDIRKGLTEKIADKAIKKLLEE